MEQQETHKCTVSNWEGAVGSSCTDIDQKKRRSKSPPANRLCVIMLVIGAAQHQGKQHLAPKLPRNHQRCLLHSEDGSIDGQLTFLSNPLH